MTVAWSGGLPYAGAVSCPMKPMTLLQILGLAIPGSQER